jgi:rubrerythrin
MPSNELNSLLDQFGINDDQPEPSILKNYSGYEIILIAEEIEKMGYLFYARAQKLARSKEANEMFGQMAKEELEHIRIINREIEPLFKGEDYSWENEENVARYLTQTSGGMVFGSPEKIKGLLEKIESHDEAVNLCLKGEKKAIAFYKNVMDHTTSPEGKKAIKRILDEEIKHVEKLEKLKNS